MKCLLVLGLLLSACAGCHPAQPINVPSVNGWERERIEFRQRLKYPDPVLDRRAFDLIVANHSRFDDTGFGISDFSNSMICALNDAIDQGIDAHALTDEQILAYAERRGLIQFISEPENAAITVNGTPRGSTITELWVEPGRYKVVLEYKNSVPQSFDVTVEARRAAVVKHKFQQTPSGMALDISQILKGSQRNPSTMPATQPATTTAE